MSANLTKTEVVHVKAYKLNSYLFPNKEPLIQIFIYLFNGNLDTKKYFTSAMAAGIMVGGNWAEPGTNSQPSACYFPQTIQQELNMHW